MELTLNQNDVADYLTFVKAKSIPRFRCVGSTISFPDEYAHLLGVKVRKAKDGREYKPLECLFDYQRDISGLSIRKKKFAIFAACGLGKQLMIFEFARHVASVLPKSKRVLLVSPLMVIEQALEECERFYGKKLRIEQVRARDLKAWVKGAGHRIGITNSDGLTDEIEQGDIGAILADESSTMKGHYGKWATTLIRLGAGLEWKLCATGTPAPNDRIEFANHAVFLDSFPNVNSFLARYFVNKGQTQERWILRPHALEAFYSDLSHWCIFLENPATYGWKDNTENIPPIHTHIHDIDMTDEQSAAVRQVTGKLFMDEAGGITKRATLSQIGKGNYKGQQIETLKPAFIRKLVDSFGDESTIIWCHYNDEQKSMERTFPEAVSIDGGTPHEKRMEYVRQFKARDKRILISKGKVLGLGLNLQVCTRMVFSGLQDSWEEFHQCCKRANRIGSSVGLNVHIPVSEVERPMVSNVLRKAHRVQMDTAEQERIFKENGIHGI